MQHPSVEGSVQRSYFLTAFGCKLDTGSSPGEGSWDAPGLTAHPWALGAKWAVLQAGSTPQAITATAREVRAVACPCKGCGCHKKKTFVRRELWADGTCLALRAKAQGREQRGHFLRRKKSKMIQEWKARHGITKASFFSTAPLHHSLTCTKRRGAVKPVGLPPAASKGLHLRNDSGFLEPRQQIAAWWGCTSGSMPAVTRHCKGSSRSLRVGAFLSLLYGEAKLWAQMNPSLSVFHVA